MTLRRATDNTVPGEKPPRQARLKGGLHFFWNKSEAYLMALTAAGGLARLLRFAGSLKRATIPRLDLLLFDGPSAHLGHVTGELLGAEVSRFRFAADQGTYLSVMAAELVRKVFAASRWRRAPARCTRRSRIASRSIGLADDSAA